MDFITRYQNAVAFIVIVAVLFGSYQFFFAEPTEEVLTTTGTLATPDQELIALLSELKAIRLEPTLFSDPVFRSLSDFGRELVPEPTGRTNPFAPFNATPVKTP